MEKIGTTPEFFGKEKKLEVVGRFKSAIEAFDKPKTYLLYGSFGRGVYTESSDIDSMLVFNDQNIDDFINENFFDALPFDPSQQLSISENDLSDLKNGAIDFLRIKGKSEDENVEFQLFPFSSIRKACGIFAPEIKGGTKRLNGNYTIDDKVQHRPTLTFSGERIYFQKKPKLALSGRRIDITEIGSRPRKEAPWIRGLTLGKLIAPKILIDELNFAEYLDAHVLRGIIRSLLFNLNLYVLDESGKPKGIKTDALDYHILFTLLRSHKGSDDEIESYQFGQEEETLLKKRFDQQLAAIIKDNRYQIYQ